MSAQAMTVTKVVIVRMVVAVVVAVVRIAVGFLGFVVHQLDSNRDLVCLTVRNRGWSTVNNGVDWSNPWERTLWPKRN
jgi:hypothetical protein